MSKLFKLQDLKDFILKIQNSINKNKRKDNKDNYKLKLWKTNFKSTNSDLLISSLKKFQVDITFTKKKVHLEKMEEIKSIYIFD